MRLTQFLVEVRVFFNPIFGQVWGNFQGSFFYWSRQCRVKENWEESVKSSKEHMTVYVCFNPISSGGRGSVSTSSPIMAHNSKMDQAITLKLGNFSQLSISKILNFMN